MAAVDLAEVEIDRGPPRFHGAWRVGVRPGTDLVHTVAATGARPLRFAAAGLPAGLALDPDTGIVRGTAPDRAGTVTITVTATNAEGSATRDLELVVGDRLALTPPMGWNSWNVYGPEVTAEVVVGVAEAMVATGMRDLGYQYVNIDDHWHAAARGSGGVPRANPRTFPDGIGAVADRVHDLGLKLGIYSDAAERTCGGCFGGYGYEGIDARAYAEWGVDLLKYDYCGAPARQEAAIARYRAMADALAGSGRTIVFSVCEWGLRRPWEWAPAIGASLWRTTPDIFDSFSWSFWGVRGIARRNLALAEWAGPGRWNDPDMLVVGNRGRGRVASRLPLGTPRHNLRVPLRGLSDAQAHSHLTLWAMMAAPLLTSADPSSLGDFDRRLVLNPEILAIDQDPLGHQGHPVQRRRGVWVLRKRLADGRQAVSFTNVRRRATGATVRLASLGLDGAVAVRDPWAARDLGTTDVLEVALDGYQSRVFILGAPPAG